MTQPSNTNDTLDNASLEAKGNSDEAILSRARAEYAMCQSSDSDFRAAAIDDLNFLTGGDNQWDPRAVAMRRADGRPIVTINQLPTFLHQVTNDQRMNTPSIKVHPVGGGADEETAKIRQGVIRHIEYDTNADIAYDRAVNSAAAIGAGYWYLDTEWESPTSSDQKICFHSVRNHLGVRTDPMSVEADGGDYQFAFIEALIARDDFKRKWPDAKANDTSWLGDSTYGAWLQKDAVLVCRYWYIDTEEATVVRLSNGMTGWKDTMPSIEGSGLTIVKERKGERKTVYLCIITGVDVLEKTVVEMDDPQIPVFPVYGDEIDIEGRVIRAGIIRNAKGPCQSFNVMMSGATEEVSLRTKAPFIGAVGQFEGMEDEWAQANVRAWPYLEYNPVTVDGAVAPPPQRQPMADIPAGMLAMAREAKDNIKATTGLFDPSLGAQGNATSGVQERAQQRQGDIANYHFTDNLNRSVLRCGRVINAMIPHYYDAERVVQIMRPDDKVEHVTINQQLPAPQQDPRTGAIKSVLNDMTGGEFSVTVSAGPAFATMRQESQEFFTQAMSAAKDPATNAIVTYLAMQNSDAPGAEIATKMLKTLLPPPAQAVIDEESNDDKSQEQMVNTPRGPVPAAQIPQIMAQLEGQLQQASETLDKAQADKQASEAAKQQAAVLAQQNAAEQLRIDAARLHVEQFNAETARLEAQTAQMEAQEQSVNNHERAIVDATGHENERLRILTEGDQAERDSARNAETAASEKAEKPALTAEDIAAAVASTKQTITGMSIKAPSGGVYDVAVQTGSSTVQ